jgi:hypothetical protein
VTPDQANGQGPAGWPLLQELQTLVSGRICSPEVRQKCQRENGSFAAWACGACQEYLRPETISPWTWHLLFLYQLRRAGYPFKANDLSLETWLLLGWVERVLEGSPRADMAKNRRLSF